MSGKSPLLLIALIVLSAIAGFYLQKRYYSPLQEVNRAVEQVKKLTGDNKLKNGDIIFQTSSSSQGLALQLATHSEYSHCGIIFHLDTGKTAWYVLEAAETVKYTPLYIWISRDPDEHYEIKRVNTIPPLTDELLRQLKTIGEKFLGKSSDPYFEWSDDKIYSSELVWKCYNELAGLEIGKLQRLQELDLTDKQVKARMEEHYGTKIPLEETIITPASISSSDYLITIEKNER